MAKGRKRSNTEIRKPKQERTSVKPESEFAQIKGAGGTLTESKSIG